MALGEQLECQPLCRGVVQGVPAQVQVPHGRVITIPIPRVDCDLGTQGGIQFTTATYNLEVAPVMSRMEFEGIVAQLNACGAQHRHPGGIWLAAIFVPLLLAILAATPFMPEAAKGFLLLPLLSLLVTIPLLILKQAAFKRHLAATCIRVNSTCRHGVNIRVFEESIYGGPNNIKNGATLSVELQVLLPDHM